MNLSELIDTHRGGRSYVDLARDCGGTPSDKRLQQIVRKPIKNFPDPPTVRALARGLRVPQRAVVLAAAESLGLEVDTSMPRLMHLLPAEADDLSEQQTAAIAHLVYVIVDDPRRMSARAGLEHQEPSEPTVPGVMAAQAVEDRRLQAVAQQGEPGDADRADELARQARVRQTEGES